MVKGWMMPPSMTDHNLTYNFIYRFNMHMVKRWLTPQDDRPGSHLQIFKDWTCTWSKYDWLPQDDRPGSHLQIFLGIEHAHGQKMIDPPRMTDMDLTYNFLKI